MLFLSNIRSNFTKKKVKTTFAIWILISHLLFHHLLKHFMGASFPPFKNSQGWKNLRRWKRCTFHQRIRRGGGGRHYFRQRIAWFPMNDRKKDSFFVKWSQKISKKIRFLSKDRKKKKRLISVKGSRKRCYFHQMIAKKNCFLSKDLKKRCCSVKE